MPTDLVPVRVDPNSADLSFWRRYHAFRRERSIEQRPDDPILPDDIEEEQMRHSRPFDTVYWYEIARGDQTLSWFHGRTVKSGAPGYEQNRHLFNASGAVGKRYRRQGIGTSWLPLVLELMDRHGCSTLTVSSEEESGHAFIRWMGAEAKLSDAENRLRLEEVDWEMVGRWIAEGPVRSPQTRLEIYDAHVPETMWQDYSTQLARLLNTMPFDDLDHGEIVITPAQLGHWYERLDLSREILYTVLTREPDGTISGMTDVGWAPYRPSMVVQRFTGVLPEARGRGIGKWVKAVMLDRIHRLHPEVEWISTWNAASNAPMLAINTKLGFKQYRAGTEYQLTRDQLATRIETLAPRS